MPESPVRVPTLKAFRHHGRLVRVGQLVTMAPLEALVAARRGEVSLSPALLARALAEEQGRRRRTYRRRDLVAESTAE